MDEDKLVSAALVRLHSLHPGHCVAALQLEAKVTRHQCTTPNALDMPGELSSNTPGAPSGREVQAQGKD